MVSLPFPKNNARIQCFGGLVPVKNWKLFDKTRQIFTGERIQQLAGPPIRGMQGEDFLSTTYFSRYYDKDNDIDKMLCEYEFTDASILGFPFLLIPKEKILFLYDPPSLIEKAPINLNPQMRAS